MNISSKNSTFLNCVAKITGKNVTADTFTPSLVFITALLPIILGTIYVDNIVTQEEKQRLKTILDQLTPSGIESYQWTTSLVQAIQTHKSYKQINILTGLTTPLSASEKLLLLVLVYQFCLKSPESCQKEIKYLQAVAKRLNLPETHFAVIQATYEGSTSPQSSAINEVKNLLSVQNFKSLDVVFIKEAEAFLTKLNGLKTQPSPTPQPTSSPVTENQNIHYSFQVKQTAQHLQTLLNQCLEELDQFIPATVEQSKTNNLDAKTLWLRLGECSSCYVQLSQLHDSFKNDVTQNEPWIKEHELNEFKSTFYQRWMLGETVKRDPSMNDDQLANEYATKFAMELKQQFSMWLDQFLKTKFSMVDHCGNLLFENADFMLANKIQGLDKFMIAEIRLLKSVSHNLDYLLKELDRHENDFDLLGFAADLTGSVVGAVSGLAGMFHLNVNVSGSRSPSPQPSLRQKTFDAGWEKFMQSKDRLLDNVKNATRSVLSQRVGSGINIAQLMITRYEKALGVCVPESHTTPEQTEAEQTWIEEQRQHITALKENLKTVLG